MVCVDKLLKGICEMFSVGGTEKHPSVSMREGRLFTKPGGRRTGAEQGLNLVAMQGRAKLWFHMRCQCFSA